MSALQSRVLDGPDNDTDHAKGSEDTRQTINSSSRLNGEMIFIQIPEISSSSKSNLGQWG